MQGDRAFIPFRQLGQYEDIETGLYYNRFRYYDCNTGAYISQDPIGLLGGKTADVDSKGKMSLIMKKISTKIQKKIDNIEKLQSQIKDWKEKTEEEVLFLLKEFEKTPRDEGSEFYTKYFTDNHFANILVKIGNTYPDNLKISLYVVSALGMMMWRYRLKETEEIYQLMLDNSQKKNVAPYVAIYLPKMQKFIDYSDKWSYFMSVKKMTPKKVAETKFIDLIEENIEEIPPKFKIEVYNYLTEKYNLANNDYSRNRYLSIINKLKK